MKLLILYGPPATGKFTIAKELSKLTGYPLFHNHLVADLASSLFDFGTKEYSDLSEKIRLSVIESGCKNKLPGMVITFTYGVETLGGGDDALLKKIINLVKKSGGKVHFIKCSASDEALKKRIAKSSRKKFRKLTDYKLLEKLRKKYEMDRPVPFAKNILLDTTKLSPKKSAEYIAGAVR